MENLYTSEISPAIDLLEVGAKQTNSNSVKAKQELKKQVKEVKKRADNLLPGNGKAPKKGVEYFVKTQMALAQTQKNPYYRLAMKISAFSGEPMTKMWKQQADVEKGQALLNESTDGVFSAIDAASGGQYDGDDLVRAMGNYMDQENEMQVSEYVKNRRDFFLSPSVFGKLFLTPLIYGHINEALELIQNHCKVKIQIEKLVESDDSTYFARLVALRMNTSRFLSGRYYSLSGNYGRLMHQQNRLMQYFKSRYGSPESSNLQYSRMLQSDRGPYAVQNQNLSYLPPTNHSSSHSYFHKLNQV